MAIWHIRNFAASKIQTIIILLGSCFLFSCSGYRFGQEGNPFYYYGIKSIAVPMFVNRSIMPGVSGPMTRSIFLTLSRYPGLTVYSGEDSRADAVLVGVIESSDHRDEAFNQNLSKRFIGDASTLKSSIGNRPGFYINNQTNYKVFLRLILIKNPRWEDRELAVSELGSNLIAPNIILNEGISLLGNFSRVLNPNTKPDDGGVTNFTNTKGIYDQSLDSLAQSAADWFRGVVVNAF